MAKQIDPQSLFAITVSIIIADVLVVSDMTTSTGNARAETQKAQQRLGLVLVFPGRHGWDFMLETCTMWNGVKVK